MENLTLPCKSIPPSPGSSIGKFFPVEISPRQSKSNFLTQKHCSKLNDVYLNSLCKNGRIQEAVAAVELVSQRGSKVGTSTYINLLQSCIDTGSIELGRKLHARINLVEEVNPFVETKLVSMYAKCGFLNDARQVFDGMRERNLFSWSAMIGACSREQKWKDVVGFFLLMMEDGVVPDDFLFPKILQACGNCEDFEAARLIHSIVVRRGMSCFLRVHNSILAVYVKCGKLSLARKLFEKMEKRDEVSWNAIITGYCQNNESDEARKLFDAMSKEGIKPGLVTWNIMIDSYNHSGNCDGAMDLMRKMVDVGLTPDVYTWTSMISGFSHNNRARQALNLFKEMLSAGVKPNAITIASLVSACGSLKSLKNGSELHSFFAKKGFSNDVLVGNSLIDMYSKCGKLEAACHVFDIIVEKDVYTWNSMIGGYFHAGYCGKAYELFMKMKESNVQQNAVTWNVMISGCLQHGNEDLAINLFQKMESEGKIKRNTASWNTLIAGYDHLGRKNKALDVFRQMQSLCISPNSVTILSVLPICANLVAEKKVREIHGCVLRRNLESELPIVNSLIDTYSKSGNILCSRTVFERTRARDVITWNSAIAGSVLHGCSDGALSLFHQMKKLGVKPNGGTFASIIHAYSLAGMVDEGRRAFSSISEDYQIIPSLEHYSAMVDIYGRSGRLGEAVEFIENMPILPDSSIWRTLLTGCWMYKNLPLAMKAGQHLLDLEPENFITQWLILQAYTLCGKPEEFVKGKNLDKENLMKKCVGQCWIEVKNTVNSFVSGYSSKSDSLDTWIKEVGEKVKRVDFKHQHGIEEEPKETIMGFHCEKYALAFGLISFSRIPRSIRIVKNLRMCEDCHVTAKYLSLTYGCEIYLRDSKCLHHFKNGRCLCGDYW